MYRSDNHPTGREDTTICFCRECGWRSERDVFGRNECPDCGHDGLSFVKFEKGAEDRAAEAAITAAVALRKFGAD